MNITREVAVRRSARLKILEGLFDLPPATTSRRRWQLPIESLDAPVLGDWRVGLVTGPSGAGKSVIAGELLSRTGGQLLGGRDADGVDRPPFDWPVDAIAPEGFPKALDVPAITGLLCSVGFSSPPDWLKPYGRLSNGQQFRVSLARALAEQILAMRQADAPVPPIGYDEFGSLVHEQVRQIAAAACAKAVRREGLRFVAVTCHDDVGPWLEADWVMLVDGDDVRLRVYVDDEAGERELAERKRLAAQVLSKGSPMIEILPRRCLRRPELILRVERCDASAWARFKRHHYLSADLSRTAACWVGLVREARKEETEDGMPTDCSPSALIEAGFTPAAFTAVMPFPHPRRPGWREHRTVCLPDFQGVGIGNAMSELVASIYARTGKPYFSTTSHPSMIAHRRRSLLWKMIRKPSLRPPHSGKGAGAAMRATTSTDRLTAGFEFVCYADCVASNRPSTLALTNDLVLV